MYKVTYDHNQSSTFDAVMINGVPLYDYLIKDEETEASRHMASCIEVFISSLNEVSIPTLGKLLAKTDFSFKTKINMAFHIGKNIPHQSGTKEIVESIYMSMLPYRKRSEFLEKNSNIVSDPEANLLACTIVHGIIA